jgi:hypothetical protein
LTGIREIKTKLTKVTDVRFFHNSNMKSDMIISADSKKIVQWEIIGAVKINATNVSKLDV